MGVESGEVYCCVDVEPVVTQMKEAVWPVIGRWLQKEGVHQVDWLLCEIRREDCQVLGGLM